MPDQTPRPTVLLVEHDPWIRASIAVAFTPKGWRILEASNGLTGLRLALKNLPTIIVVGQALPELGPDGLLRELRAQVPTRHIPVVLSRDALAACPPGHATRRALTDADIEQLAAHTERAIRHTGSGRTPFPLQRTRGIIEAAAPCRTAAAQLRTTRLTSDALALEGRLTAAAARAS